MIGLVASLAAVSWYLVHLGSHPESSTTVHYSYLAGGLVVGSVVASGLYWYYSSRAG